MQYGFRKKRGTRDAIHCIRRIIDKGESTRTPTILVLLDWEKAFDRVSQEGMLKAMERLNVDAKIIRVIRAMYNNPTFMVEIDGVESGWHPQRTGIRQGCPLSPYLFVAFMTVLMHDVQRRQAVKDRDRRVKGANFDEVLYADDTICVSEDAAAMNRILKNIEEEGAKYGMKLNYKKSVS
jgi:hypothetical protein